MSHFALSESYRPLARPGGWVAPRPRSSWKDAPFSRGWSMHFVAVAATTSSSSWTDRIRRFGPRPSASESPSSTTRIPARGRSPRSVSPFLRYPGTSTASPGCRSTTHSSTVRPCVASLRPQQHPRHSSPSRCTGRRGATQPSSGEPSSQSFPMECRSSAFRTLAPAAPRIVLCPIAM
mgnify:CR=1 FL=1